LEKVDATVTAVSLELLILTLSDGIHIDMNHLKKGEVKCVSQSILKI
jgi:hypothetical protein